MFRGGIISETHSATYIEKFEDVDEPIFAVDTREPNNMTLIADVENDFRVEKIKLETGDFAIIDQGEVKAAVERKKVTDLMGSLNDKRKNGAYSNMSRFYAQVNELTEVPVGYLMVVGTLRSVKKELNNVNYDIHDEAYFGALSSVSVRYYGEVPILQAASDRESVRMISIIFEKVLENKVGLHKSPPTKNMKMVNILATFLGVNVSHNLADEYDSIYEVCKASREELQEIRGIGPATAGKIHGKLRE